MSQKKHEERQTADAARAEFQHWLNEHQGEFGHIGEVVFGLMERAAVEVATRLQQQAKGVSDGR
ncbi:MAG: hypothetical protein R3175_07390 [Marinobacter sp.]|uniref:hypothetical protein n=1 Tax=Marinobacter sp. TaxID=50741 RepID=UPI00299D1C70|nr:hypothetical protein [Marinobacter sp.]MDX1755863.1 hypothetical protein [Marinobacter sp.]